MSDLTLTVSREQHQYLKLLMQEDVRVRRKFKHKDPQGQQFAEDLLEAVNDAFIPLTPN